MDDAESLRRLAEEQAALRRVATLVAMERDPGRVFGGVCEETARRLGARQCNLARFLPDKQARTVGDWSEPGTPSVPLGVGTMDGPTLGGLIRSTGRPARVDDDAEVPGRSAESLRELGLRSGIGAPVYVAGDLWGALMLSSDRPHGFPPEAEQRVAEFAELAGVAVAGADARERLERLAEEQAALRRVATLVAMEHDAETLFAAVTEEAARVMGMLQANLSRFVGEYDAFVLGSWTGPGGVAGVGSGERVTLDGQTVSGLVRDTGRPSRVDDYELTTGPLARRICDLGIRSAVGAPIRVGGELWGVLTVQSERKHAFPPGAEDRVQDFAELVAVALSEADAREALAASRARIVEASYEARRRIERDLHDGAQQRLVSLALDLSLLETDVQRDPEAAPAHVAAARAKLDAALRELRELARGIHPAVLSERGLVAALEGLAARSTVPVELEAELNGRPPAAVEAAAYFVASEALANVAKYAPASFVAIRLSHGPDQIVLRVSDDGAGGADPDGGSGLRGLRDRVEALGGRLVVDSPPGEGTAVVAELPTVATPRQDSAR
jgi:signal transduction histidine kinase